ncbi:MAG: DEAD/DEAH box helicase, partial [Candidatus Methylomirabilales bacterium]
MAAPDPASLATPAGTARLLRQFGIRPRKRLGQHFLVSSAALEAILQAPSARALFLFPIKALEQDQLKSLQSLIPWGFEIKAAILDGDTPSSKRAQLQEDPPHVLITNPDFLHVSLLPHHEAWKAFFQNLRYVVLDELHTYKGIFGSHIAHVIRRLRRIAAHYGANPQFIASSATIANPKELAETITGLPFTLIQEDGAPRRGKHFLLVGPKESPYTAATDLLLRCVRKGLKTIAFAKARKIAELIYMWAKEIDQELARGIKPYRAGYLPRERREIEQGLFTERLSGVVATSALELGIDVGGLDACILVGYPGSIASTWQRGGRVGRGEKEALIALVALPDALDQYFLRHPEDFFSRSFEAAIIDPLNQRILADHLVCAADELPLRPLEGDLYGETSLRVLEGLAAEGKLNLSADGREWYARRRRPQLRVNIRSIGEGYAIVDLSGKSIGTVDGVRALHECHEGAIYLHQGRQYEVLKLDLEQKKVIARLTEVDYYTQALSEKETEVLSTESTRQAGATSCAFGHL